MTGCDFSTNHYKDMMARAREMGYGIFNFADWVNKAITGSRTLLLRHDVDLSLDRFRRMMEVEAELGVRSTYFLRLHATAYQLLEPESYLLVRKAVAAGVDIGLHYDGFFYDRVGGDTLDWLGRDARIMEAILGRPALGCSAHLPTQHSPIDMASVQKVGLAYEAYGTPFTKARKYISDSSRHWREGCLCQWLGKADHLTVLVHPIWWFELEDTPENIIATVRTGK